MICFFGHLVDFLYSLGLEFVALSVTKMLQWIKMDPKEYQWAKQANLDIKWFTP
jgi:hypothetical protein